jgi:hypothetical protein
MPGVERQAVGVDVTTITTRILRPFAVVAIEAERLQGAEAEGVPVAAMRWVMIGDGSDNDPTLS